VIQSDQEQAVIEMGFTHVKKYEDIGDVYYDAQLRNQRVEIMVTSNGIAFWRPYFAKSPEVEWSEVGKIREPDEQQRETKETSLEEFVGQEVVQLALF
jgi:hypothetical protein